MYFQKLLTVLHMYFLIPVFLKVTLKTFLKELHLNVNVIYLISCKCCGNQYIDSAISFKERFRIHKSDINTGKVRCGVANHLLNVCHSEGNKFEYLQIQLIEQVSVSNSKNIDKMLCEREKYWQAQLFTLKHGLNSPNEWYAKSKRGYRK